MRQAGRLFPWLAAVAIVMTGMLPVLAQTDLDFMPKGGKTLLLELLGSSPDSTKVSDLTAAKHDEAEWRDLLAAQQPAMGDRERATLSAYLAINMPLAPEAAEIARTGDPNAAFPRDGRDLAWNGCQGCHSLFAGYLTQDRDLQGWQNMFNSPFHRELRMTPQERDEFSRYSAINMPMKFEDVPEELRF